VILGGLGAFWGPVLGALTLTLLPELLRFAGTTRLVVNAAVVLFIAIYYPQGIVGTVRQLRSWIERPLRARRAGSPRGRGSDQAKSEPVV